MNYLWYSLFFMFVYYIRKTFYIILQAGVKGISWFISTPLGFFLFMLFWRVCV